MALTTAWIDPEAIISSGARIAGVTSTQLPNAARASSQARCATPLPILPKPVRA
jgi:hypothetical protein